MRSPWLVSLGLLAAGCSHLAADLTQPEGRNPGQLPGGVLQRYQARLSKGGTMPDGAIMRAKLQRDLVVGTQSALDLPGPPIAWTWFGPGNIGGRIREILIHPVIHSRMWVASSTGGVWRTDNAGAAWYPMNDFLPIFSIGCMVMDPADPDRIYVGTGEGFFDAVEGSSNTAAVQGAGIFLTTDGGATWNQIPATATPDWHFVNRIAVCPTQPALLLAATGSGIWRSTDSGATWSRRTTTRTFDMDFHPTDPLQAVAGRADGFAQYSTDGGVSWSNAVGPTNSTRVELAYARSNPTMVYCTASDNSGRIRVWRSGNGGQGYALRTTDSGISTYSLYNNALWVDPTNSDRIAIGGVQLYRSIDGGVTRTQFTSGAHADYHVVVHHPLYDGTSNRRVYTGNDGGIHTRTDLLSGSWQSLNNNLGITQFYGAAINPTTGRVIAGAQDNGTSMFTGNPNGWNYNVIGGDGGFCAADPSDPNYFYGEYQYLNIRRSSNAGVSFSAITSGISDPGTNFIPFYMLDPNDPNRMLACGRALWRTNNVKAGTPTWSQVKAPRGCTDLISGPPNAHFRDNPVCNISICEVARGNSDIVWVGHNDGEIYRTQNGTAGSPSWTQVEGSGGVLPDRWVGSIAIDPDNHQRVYVAFMGYEADNLWRTTDNGANWQRITGTAPFALPSAPIAWITRHLRLPGWLYAGTDVGIFCSTDDGATWTAVTDGPGPVPIDQILWRDTARMLVVTHGRGVYEGAVLTATVQSVGVGCGPGSPVLTASAPVLGASQAYQATAAPANAPVWFGYSFGPPVPTSVPPCTIQIDLPNAAPYFAGLTGGSGTWNHALSIPLNPALAGAMLTAQAVVFQVGGALLGVGELSNGLELVLGF